MYNIEPVSTNELIDELDLGKVGESMIQTQSNKLMKSILRAKEKN